MQSSILNLNLFYGIEQDMVCIYHRCFTGSGISFHFNRSRDDIFGRMVTGTAKDEFKFVSLQDSNSTAAIAKDMKDYGYVLQNEIDKGETKYILADATLNDSALKLQQKFTAARIVSADYITGRKQKPIDGIIATAALPLLSVLG